MNKKYFVIVVLVLALVPTLAVNAQCDCEPANAGDNPCEIKATQVVVPIGTTVYFDGRAPGTFSHTFTLPDGLLHHGPIAQYTFEEADLYSVKLMIKDNAGMNHFCEISVTVYDDLEAVGGGMDLPELNPTPVVTDTVGTATSAISARIDGENNVANTFIGNGNEFNFNNGPNLELTERVEVLENDLEEKNTQIVELEENQGRMARYLIEFQEDLEGMKKQIDLHEKEIQPSAWVTKIINEIQESADRALNTAVLAVLSLMALSGVALFLIYFAWQWLLSLLRRFFAGAKK